MRSKKARITTLAALAAASACLTASPAAAGAASTTYPAGVSHFDSGAEGWTPGPTSCAPVELLCSAESVYSSTTGNPPGSIAEQTRSTVNLVSLFEGTETWNSPQFTVQGGLLEGATLTLDRAFDEGSLAAVEPTAAYTVTLDDLGTGTSQVLLTEGLGPTDSAFVTENAPAAVIGGHTYELSLEGTTGQGALALSLFSGTSAIRFDNVGLQVQSADGEGGDEGPGGGEAGDPGSGGGAGSGTGMGSAGSAGDGPSGSGGTAGDGSGPGDTDEGSGSNGIRVIGGSLSDAAISRLIGSTSLEAEVGHHPGGSLIAPSRCTVIGTPGPDRIVGTQGNDVICGLGGNDVITGLGGRDVLDGGAGSDRLIGGTGGDLLLGLAGKDQEIGSGGADRLGGGAGNDRLMGGAGKDMLVGRSGADHLYGNAGDDLLKARDGGRDVVNGGAGTDVASGDHADRPRGVERMK